MVRRSDLFGEYYVAARSKSMQPAFEFKALFSRNPTNEAQSWVSASRQLAADILRLKEA
jgi:hypothetical protein